MKLTYSEQDLNIIFFFDDLIGNKPFIKRGNPQVFNFRIGDDCWK